MESPDGDGFRWLAKVEANEPRTRMNDAACDALGRLWAGTMDLEESEPIGALYRLAANDEAATALPGLTVSNGLGWSPDGRVFYHIDSPRMGVDAFDFEPSSGPHRQPAESHARSRRVPASPTG